MSLAFAVEETVLSRTETQTRSAAGNVAVIATSIESTLAALRKAGEIAGRRGDRIALIVPQVVPYPLSLSDPPVPVAFNQRRFRVLAGESSVETRVSICLGRDRLEILQGALAPHSVVVIGGRKSWWPSVERRLTRLLRKAGHEVVLVEG